jgi:hypothetical protein
MMNLSPNLELCDEVRFSPALILPAKYGCACPEVVDDVHHQLLAG